MDVEGSGNRNNGRDIVSIGKRMAVFCHGNGEVKNETHQETYKRNQRNEL